MLRIPCGNPREDVCLPCSEVYKGDARQIIRSGLTGGKGIPESVATHPCVFATLTAPGSGPVHTIRTGRGGRRLACRPAAMRTSDAARMAGTSPAPATITRMTGALRLPSFVEGLRRVTLHLLIGLGPAGGGAGGRGQAAVP